MKNSENSLSRFEGLHYGRVYTHLDALYLMVESKLDASPDELSASLDAVRSDIVYQSIASGEFHPPRGDSAAFRRFTGRLETIRKSTANRRGNLNAFLEPFDHIGGNHPSSWDPHCYFIIPVVTEFNGNHNTGMMYLHSTPKAYSSLTYERLDITELTGDPVLQSIGGDYFGTLASLVIRTFYFVQSYPFEYDPFLKTFTYKLFFDCRITEGKSMGAAVFGIFAVNFLHWMLAGRFNDLVAPQCGTVITGEVDNDGRIVPVDNLEEKIACVVEEYGSSVRVILPHGEEIPSRLRNLIDRRNVWYVGTVEDLLEAILTSALGVSGLMQARSVVFAHLPPHHPGILQKYLCKGVAPDVYEQMAKGGQDWIVPNRHEGGIYSITTAWESDIEVRIGLEPSGVQKKSDGIQRRELVEVIVDGTGLMDAFWAADPETHVCKITIVLFEIARRIDAEKQDLVCGFLGDRDFHPIRSGESAQQLETFIQHKREERRFQYRGPYFRPLYETSVKQYSDRLKRVYIISDSYVPDIADLTDLNVSSLRRLYLSGENQEEGIPEESDVVLFPGQGKIDVKILDRFFQKTSGTIQNVRIDLGKELPLEWNPADAVLSWRDDRYILCFTDLDALNYEMQVRMAYKRPLSFGISGTLAQSPDSVVFSFTEYPRVNNLEIFTNNARTGSLTEEEFRLWQNVRQKKCPCGIADIHLTHERDLELRSKPIFQSLSDLVHGHLLVCGGSREWSFFTSGCRYDGICFVVVDGTLHWSQKAGHLDAIPRVDGVYSLQTEKDTYYLCKL